ncbi:MAG: zinc-dependent metalloprotease, partial [Planctomycetota bacterium]|nr:zinc-dependent metalloprotease [Planctomycetota bacterium]
MKERGEVRHADCASFWARGVVLLALALSGCMGGSSSSGFPITVSFLSGTGSSAEGGGNLIATVVLHTAAGPLVDPVTVDVGDIGTGTGTVGVDYHAFGIQTVTFPEGSVDGAQRTLTIDPIDDLSVEGVHKTVRLTLSNPVGTALSGSVQFLATLLDDDVAQIRFDDGGSVSVAEGGGAHTVTLELILAGGVQLDVDAAAQLFDVGSGSATVGLDYAAFVQGAPVFVAGSLNGATLPFSVQVLDDGNAEANETIVLSLGSPSAGTAISGAVSQMITIQDDDGGSPQAFVASEGLTGIENSLVAGESVDLGTSVAGSFANVGTLLRVTNAGNQPMELGPPVLSGSNAEDFLVEVEQASLAFGMAPVALSGMHDMYTPMAVGAPDPGPGLALTLDEMGLAELHSVSQARLIAFPLPDHGEVTLELERMRLPIARDAVLMVDGVAAEGGLLAAVGGLSLWKGTVLEIPGSNVFLSFTDAGPEGVVELPEGENRYIHLYTETPATALAPAACRLVTEHEFLALGGERPPVLCAGEVPVPGVEPESLEIASLAPPGTASLTASNCDLAIETDFQLYQKFGSVSGTSTYVTKLIATVSAQYYTDIQTTLSISYLGVYSNSNDPWTSQDGGGDAGDLLAEFRGDWNANGWPAPANLAHFISGAGLGGGVAYLNTLCNSSYGYGVSGNINGNVNWDGWTGNPGSFTWDFVVVAHELGHNFGSSHTQDFCPPIDHCYTNCEGSTNCTQGTIMSYCHTCGGMDNIDLR